MLYYKERLLKTLESEGLTHTVINFIHKYERKKCTIADCPHFNKPYLGTQLDFNGRRVYSDQDIKDIVDAAKKGWFIRHWHWFPT
jgi:hypothetical protein